MGALDLVGRQFHKNGTRRLGELINLELSIVIGVGSFEALFNNG